MEARVLRIVTFGPECTGKTTLAENLARRCAAAYVPEFVRGFVDRKQAPVEEGDVAAIAKGVIDSHDAEKAPLAFLDTDLWMTVLYARFYYGGVADWIVDEARRRTADGYLLCDVDLPWVADGQRDQPHRRHEMLALCRATLDEAGARYALVRGSGDARLDAATTLVEAWTGKRCSKG